MSVKPESIDTISVEELNQLDEDAKNLAQRHLYAFSRLKYASDYLSSLSAPITEHQRLKETIEFLLTSAKASRDAVRTLILPIKEKGARNARKKNAKKGKKQSRSASTRRSAKGRTRRAKKA